MKKYVYVGKLNTSKRGSSVFIRWEQRAATFSPKR